MDKKLWALLAHRTAFGGPGCGVEALKVVAPYMYLLSHNGRLVAKRSDSLGGPVNRAADLETHTDPLCPELLSPHCISIIQLRPRE